MLGKSTQESASIRSASEAEARLGEEAVSREQAKGVGVGYRCR